MFVNLHTHSEYSLLDGGIKIKELFKYVKSLGQTAVGITEHGNLGGLIKKYQLAKKEGIKLVIGVEAYLVGRPQERSDEKRYHLVLYAMNKEGYRNLVRLMSKAALEGYYYKPRISMEWIRQYSEGLICTSACLQNNIAQGILNNSEEDLISEYLSIFGKDRFFLEVANHGIPEEKIIAERYFELAKKYGIKVTFGGDAHYLRESDAKAHAVLLCNQTKTTLKNPKRFKFTGGNYHILSEQEARCLFPDNQEVFDNTNLIADMCNVEFEFGNHVFPKFEVPEGYTNETYFDYLVWEGYKRKYGENEEAKQRIIYEMSVIKKMGYIDYFLIIGDVIREMNRRQGISSVGRGSAGSSCVAYCLDIHQIEPLSNKLLFERFLNPDRISLPDIDTDFADRDMAVKYVQEKYGQDKVALIGTYGTMSSKSVIKDVSRVYDIPFDDVNRVTKLMVGTIEESMVVPEFSAFALKYPEVIEVSKTLEGSVRHRGVHAAGVVLGLNDIWEHVPVWKSEDQIITQLDMWEVEDIGLVKFDFLGLKTMAIILEAIKMIGKDDQWLLSLPLDDPEVYKLLSSGNNAGIFQSEGQGMSNAYKKIKPTCFNDISSIIALYRPGSMDYVDMYANRKNGLEQFDYEHPILKDVLSDSYSILIYQESVMQLCVKLCGFTNAEADTMRKIIGKKLMDKMLQMEIRFKEGAKKTSNVTDSFINSLWDKIVKFADYSFNRAHASSYAMSVYRTAYLKAHYPVEFMTALINSEIGDIEKVAEYIGEARKMGIQFLPPDINKSNANFTKDGEAIRFGLGCIKNLAGESLETIMSKKPYSSYIDFVSKTNVNKRIRKHLVYAGCFDTLHPNRNSLVAGYDNVTFSSSGGEVQTTLVAIAGFSYSLPRREKPTLKQLIDWEIEAMGMPATADISELYPGYKDLWIPKDLNLEGTSVRVFGIVKEVKKIYTKKDGREMCFTKIENGGDVLEVVVFPDLYSISKHMIVQGGALQVDGRMSNGNVLASIILEVK